MDSLLSSFSLMTNDGCGLVVTFFQIISLGILIIDGATFTSFFKLAHSVRSTEIINFVELAVISIPYPPFAPEQKRPHGGNDFNKKNSLFLRYPLRTSAKIDPILQIRVSHTLEAHLQGVVILSVYPIVLTPRPDTFEKGASTA